MSVFLAIVAAAAVARAFLQARYDLLRPLDAPPLEGAARAAFHVDEALDLSVPAALAGTALALFDRPRRAILPGLAWCAAVAYLATHYPEVRGDELRRVDLCAELCALVVAAAAVVTWTWERRAPSPAHVAFFLVGLSEAGLVVLANVRPSFWSPWDATAAGFALLHATLTLMQVSTWRSLSQSPSSQS